LARSQQLGPKPVETDPVLSTIQRGVDYASINSNKVLGVLVGILVVVGIGIFVSRDREAKRNMSSDNLSMVAVTFANGAFDQVIELANTVQANHPNTEAAILSKYFAGVAQLRVGKFSEAEATLQSYLSDAAKAPFYESAARTALAASLEGQKKHAEAAALYEAEIAKLPENLANQARIHAARAYAAAGSRDKARGLLQQLSEEATPAGREAKLELAIIDSQQP
jgi:tetratricopeptide (TPR) repeat protein